jgi:hypothetical protein
VLTLLKRSKIGAVRMNNVKIVPNMVLLYDELSNEIGMEKQSNFFKKFNICDMQEGFNSSG